MSSDFDMSLIDIDDDPNAASRNQVTLKQVETAIRRYCDPDLMLMFDGIALLDDENKKKQEMLKLKKILEQKSREVGKVPHVEGND